MVRRLIRKLGEREGFTLIELLVVVAILALLAAIAAPKIGDVITKSKEARKRADLKVVSGALERYFNDVGKYPTSLAELQYKGYLKQDFDFKNGYGFYYFYAVDRISDPQHYAVGDPGRQPYTTSMAITSAVSSGTTMANPLPQGRAPTLEAFWWVDGTAGGRVALQNEGGSTIDILEVPPTLSRYCASYNWTTNDCTSGWGNRPFRYDMITD